MKLGFVPLFALSANKSPELVAKEDCFLFKSVFADLRNQFNPLFRRLLNLIVFPCGVSRVDLYQ